MTERMRKIKMLLMEDANNEEALEYLEELLDDEEFELNEVAALMVAVSKEKEQLESSIGALKEQIAPLNAASKNKTEILNNIISRLGEVMEFSRLDRLNLDGTDEQNNHYKVVVSASKKSKLTPLTQEQFDSLPEELKKIETSIRLTKFKKWYNGEGKDAAEKLGIHYTETTEVTAKVSPI